MSTYVMTDSLTMLRRNLTHARRYPSMTIGTLAVPVVMLLLFGGVFGSALGGGISTGLGGGDYINYLAPGVILVAATSGSIATAVSVCVDATQGVMNRLRTMAVARSAILTGHVIGGVLQTLLSVALVIGVALLMGFRPNGDALEWVAAAGILTLLVFALTWLSAGFGLVARNAESASNMPTPLTFLPLLGSGFVPTDSMPAGVRHFAEYQPFTPIIETVRGLLMGTGIGSAWVLALAWCVVIALVGFLWSRRAFERRTNRPT
ncbi:ABC transporter permease [Actinophytocola xanthii]|uniref:Transport permease protein n=1 Tax=Actinophytocola xanthii TaxID=1912961 RepID=A0A1Q8CLB9_9PSEU|nr:ABC transporter permease [Actinophytocola xanthii]OLF15155.1 ABC transporter permease [Actinophytocola xanthii]